MKKLTSTERGGLVLATVLFLPGLVWLVWPREGVIVRPTNDYLGSPGSATVLVSKKGSRTYGVVSMVFGAIIGALALYRSKD